INQKMIESEAFYRAIFENTGTATIIVNSDGTIASANKECFRVTGYQPEQLIGTHWQNYVSEESLPTMKEYFSLRFTNPEKAPTRYEAKLVDAKGRVRNAILQIGLIKHTKQIVVSMLDITEQRQLEAQLLQAQKLESIGRLAGGVAHDFNNMLNVIIGYAEMGLNKVAKDSPLHKYLTNILTAARKSAETTNRLLGFARKQMISPKVLDLNRTIENMLDMLKRLIGENIELLWAPGLNLWKVKMDPDQVSQILVNLLVNAKDAIEGQGKVIIETENVKIDEQYCQTHAEAFPGKFVRLSVTDTGCGMPEEVLEHIFEPFFTTKDVGKGTGLGLATVYGIVKQNNGFVNVYSEVGKGTTFKIYLPKYGNDTEEEEETLQRPYTVPYGKGETVLVVEDEPDVLGITKDMLEAINYKVITAKKPSEALKLLEEHKGALDLVLTDVVMPEMSGKELLLKLRERFPDLKALFMSGYTENAIIHNGVLDRGEKLIQKPFTLRELATKVRQVLEGSSDIS
ncbi:MAG: PAS domain S-box protein, partial [Nitrospirae bacterium]